MASPKYSRYQDYVIRDGRLVGEFEEMYRDFGDPWHQTTRERFASEKAIALNLLGRLRAMGSATRVVEIGCGLGDFSARIAATGVEVTGVDVSKTAIEKARTRHADATGRLSFAVADFKQFDLITDYQPDVIVMSEVTWYVLEHLDAFRSFAASALPNALLLHLLTIYREGDQQYGRDYFTNLDGILRYFGMRYLQSGQVNLPGGNARTWFLGTWQADVEHAWSGAE